MREYDSDITPVLLPCRVTEGRFERAAFFCALFQVDKDLASSISILILFGNG